MTLEGRSIDIPVVFREWQLSLVDVVIANRVLFKQTMPPTFTDCRLSGALRSNGRDFADEQHFVLQGSLWLHEIAESISQNDSSLSEQVGRFSRNGLETLFDGRLIDTQGWIECRPENAWAARFVYGTRDLEILSVLRGRGLVGPKPSSPMLTVLVLHNPPVSSRLIFTIKSPSALLFVLATGFWSPRSPFVILTSICTTGRWSRRQWKAVQGQHFPEWCLDSACALTSGSSFELSHWKNPPNMNSNPTLARNVWYLPLRTLLSFPLTKLILTPPSYSRVLPEQLLSFWKSWFLPRVILRSNAEVSLENQI